MQPADSASTFEAAVTDAGMTVQGLNAATALAQMEAFYRDVRADNCILDEEGDTLRCEWGVNGQGADQTFQLEFSRHFIEPGDEDEDGMSELALTLTYAPAPDLMALEPGSCQCSLPSELSEFAQSIRASQPFQALAALKPQQTALAWWLT